VQCLGEVPESIDGDSLRKLIHVGEVRIENGLAVLDLGGQPTRGDGFPSFGFGELARRRDNQAASRISLARATVLDGHTKP
jgi:hypothetical protein